MDLLLDFSAWSFLLITVAIAVLFIYKWHTSAFNHWKKRGVPYLEPLPLFGNFKDLLLSRVSQAEGFKQFYDKLKNKKFGGIFLMYQPLLLVCDPVLIKQIMVKDFHCFQDRGLPFDTKKDPLVAHLLNLRGTHWKNMRVKLTPAFTSTKIKQMFSLLLECANNLQYVLDDIAEMRMDIEVKDLMARYTTDVIASCGFGLKCNSIQDPESEFRNMGRKVFHSSFITNLRQTVRHISPTLFKLFFQRVLPKEVTEFFTNIVKETMQYRLSNSVHRNDFMELLIQLKTKGKVCEEDESSLPSQDNCEVDFTDNLLAAQAFIFFVAGFETSSTTLTFCLYELAMNEEIQTELRNEMRRVLKKNGEALTYQCIQEMEYLDRVVNETLRKYPPGSNLLRVVTQDCTLTSTKVQLRCGEMVMLPVYAIHRDPDYYPNPDVWDPERFTEEAKATRPPFTFIPFGEGPRHCIGMRLGYLIVKVGLAVILSNYRVSISKKTEVPLKLSKTTFITTAAGGIWLKFSKCTPC